MRRILILLLLALPAPALAQSYGKAVAEPAREPNLPAIGIDQRLGERVPLDLVFRDEHDNPVTLGQCVDGKPTILVLAYYRCPQMCNLVLNGVLECVKKMPPDLGADFNVVTVSFDPKDRAPVAYAKKQHYLAEYGRPNAEPGLRFLTGEQAAVDAVCKATGFRYEYDKQKKQFNHASGIMVITKDGRLSKYFYGIAYDAELVRAALEDAAGGRIGKPVEPGNIVMMLCFDYNPQTGKYTFTVLKALRAVAAVTVLGVGTWLFFAWRRPRKPGPPAAQAAAAQPAGTGGTDPCS